MTPPPVTVLLIEDDPGDTDFLQELLADVESYTFAIRCADHLATGLTHLAVGGIDVVLLDLSLPDSQGLDTVARVQSAAPTVPIVVLTGLADDTTALRAVQAGAQDYLSKGDIDDRTLRRALRYAIERQRADTTRQQLEAQLRQAQKLEAIGTLASGIAHDFNNILGASLGFTELALDTVPQDSVAWGYLQEVFAAGQRAKALVRQILTFSRQAEHDPKPVTLHPILEEALSLLRASLPATIAIHPHIATDTGTVLADPTHIHQVLMNLGTNAAHAMRDSGGVLEVRLEAVDVDARVAAQHARQPGSYVRLTVQDTGHGIPPDVLERICEPFFTTKGPGEGTGLGLAVVHGIVTDYGGILTVDSTPGAGTTVAISLPRLTTVAPDGSAPQGPIPAGRECILFVDDEPAIARLGHALLTRLGYTVVVRTSSVEALEAFRGDPQRFDLVITDQTMPQMTGEALACALRRLRPDIPILLCTGFSHTLTPEKAQALGLDAVCLKPLVARDLGVTIRRVLARRATQSLPIPADPGLPDVFSNDNTVGGPNQVDAETWEDPSHQPARAGQPSNGSPASEEGLVLWFQ